MMENPSLILADRELSEVVPLSVRRSFEKQYNTSWEDGTAEQKTKFLDQVRNKRIKKKQLREKKKQEALRKERRDALKEQKAQFVNDKREREKLKWEIRKKKLKKNFDNMFKKGETSHNRL